MEQLSDDLMSPAVVHDPHSYYHQLRDADPVHWNDRWGGWVITRYEDAIKVPRNADAFSADRMGFLERELSDEDRETITPIFDVLSSWMVFTDPPLHTQLRSLVNRQFTPKEVERYRGQVRAIVNDALDAVEAKGEMEVIKDFAYKVPMTVILDLMGVPDLNREKIKEWSEELGLFFFIRADEPRRRHFATSGVSVITRIDFTSPAATLRAITSLEAPSAVPVTGPTMYVAAPPPIVVMLTGSRYPNE